MLSKIKTKLTQSYQARNMYLCHILLKITRRAPLDVPFNIFIIKNINGNHYHLVNFHKAAPMEIITIEITYTLRIFTRQHQWKSLPWKLLTLWEYSKLNNSKLTPSPSPSDWPIISKVPWRGLKTTIHAFYWKTCQRKFLLNLSTSVQVLYRALLS